MLSRLLPKSSHCSRLLHHLSSKSHSCPLSLRIYHSNFILRHFSSDHNSNNNKKDQSTSNIWNLSTDDKFDPFFPQPSDDGGITGKGSWLDDDVTERVEESTAKDAKNAWLNSEGYNMWSLEDDKHIHPFDIGEVADGRTSEETEASAKPESEKIKEQKLLEEEEKELTAVLKGPNRAFGDLITASGITDDMLDSLIALRDFQDVEGLPPLSEIEDMRYEKNTRRSTRAEIERQKQEEVAKARVRQVDDKGRAYGTGRRKCSVARVWIEPGDGKFLINDKQFDVYFPMLDHRAALLRPFSETKTLGLWDVKCTVQGGGTTGQVGAIQLGISRALQNWEPDLRPPLRNSGFLTRDPRVVERKKPGKAKARKSFQWVKR